MKAYLEVPHGLSRAMSRVANALALYMPSDFEISVDAGKADLTVLHVIGHPETVDAVRAIRARGGRYAVIQYCMRSTQEPHTHAWRDVWAGADVVWSYYDLPALVREDGGGEPDFNFYLSPLGVDSWVFTHQLGDRRTSRAYTILSSGYVAESECVREIAEAVSRVPGGTQFHLGPPLGLPRTYVRTEMDLTDGQLAGVYSSCRYVAGLRRCEGFELPAAEGLLCGARPVVFDRPHYRRWFDPWAVFIPEDDYDRVVKSLIDVFRGDYRPVTGDEIAAAAERFNWERIADGFWSRVRAEVRS